MLVDYSYYRLTEHTLLTSDRLSMGNSAMSRNSEFLNQTRQSFELMISIFGFRRQRDPCSNQTWQKTQQIIPGFLPMKSSYSNGTIPHRMVKDTSNDVRVFSFGVFQSHAHATAAPCIILLLLHKTENKARLVLGNQNWTIQEQFLGMFRPRFIVDLTIILTSL